MTPDEEKNHSSLQQHLEILEEGQSELKRQNETIYEKINQIDSDLKNLTLGVAGNSNIGITGIVKRLEALEDFMHKQEKIHQKILGAGTIIGILWTLLMKFWDKVL